VQVLSKDN
jgi:hypothetical protein